MYLSDVHTHTIASGHGGRSTINEMAREAAGRGLKLLGITDHGPATLSSATPSYFRGLAGSPRKRFGLELLFGAECSILDACGGLDLEKEVQDGLDYLIASLHPGVLPPGGEEENTRAVLSALKNPRVRILGHPDDPAYRLSYPAIVRACKEHQVIVEMNEISLSPHGYRGDARPGAALLLDLCRREGVPIVLSSDSHGKEGVGLFPHAQSFVHAACFPQELILNNQIPRLKMLLGLRE